MNSACHRTLLLLGLAWSVNAQPTTLADPPLRGGDTRDAKKLYGSWRLEKMSECDGETGKVKEEAFGKGRVEWTVRVSAGDTVTIMIAGVKFFEWRAAYDLKKTPPWVDLTPRFPHEEKEKRKGLLGLKDDKLLIHFGAGGSDARPTDFKQRKGLNSILIVCKRIK